MKIHREKQQSEWWEIKLKKIKKVVDKAEQQ